MGIGVDAPDREVQSFGDGLGFFDQLIFVGIGGREDHTLGGGVSGELIGLVGCDDRDWARVIGWGVIVDDAPDVDRRAWPA